jgi:hypothetical protein
MSPRSLAGLFFHIAIDRFLTSWHLHRETSVLVFSEYVEAL